MKINFVWLVFVIVNLTSSCQRPKDNIPCIDVRKNYPEKICLLTDIADVTYLHIHSDDDKYLFSGSIRAVTEHTIFIADDRSGDFLFFSKDGFPKSRFNRKGNGPEEYKSTRRVFYDEETDNVFVVDDNKNDHIQVYSSTGKYKQGIILPKGTLVNNDIVSYDAHSFVFYDAAMEFNRSMADNLSSEMEIATYYLISKNNGSVLDRLELPVAPIFIGTYRNGIRVPSLKVRLIQSKDGVLLCNPESDTVFLYGKNKSLTPILHKIPLVSSTSPLTYISNCIDTEIFLFFDICICTAVSGIPDINHFIQNKQTKEIFRQKIVLPDYEGKDFIISPTYFRFLYHSGCFFELDLLELKEAYTQDRLKGNLKELVASLKEDDNNVYVLAQFK